MNINKLDKEYLEIVSYILNNEEFEIEMPKKIKKGRIF